MTKRELLVIIRGARSVTEAAQRIEQIRPDAEVLASDAWGMLYVDGWRVIFEGTDITIE